MWVTDLPLTGRKPSIKSMARSDHTVASARREAVKVLLDGGDQFCSVDTWDMHSQIHGLLLSTPGLKKYALNRFNVLSEPSCPVPWAWVSNDYLTGDDAGKNTLPFTVINPSTMRHWSPLDPLCTLALSAYNSRSVSISRLKSSNSWNDGMDRAMKRCCLFRVAARKSVRHDVSWTWPKLQPEIKSN
jgi:hypothetical protein